MKLNRNELKKIQYDFNCYSNRLLQANFQDYTDVLKKFLNYIESNPIIFDYIQECGDCAEDVSELVEEVARSFGRSVFAIGDTEEKEVCDVYNILRYLANTNNSVYRGVAMGYSTSDKYQDKIKGFNNRFVMVLIGHIERYLTKVGIDMGLDDKVVYNVTVQNGQAIIANDNAMVTATNNIGIDADKLKNLIEDVRATTTTLSPEDQEMVSDCLETIENEVTAEKPKKGLLRTALATLKSVKGITEFAAAAAALIQFVSVVL